MKNIVHEKPSDPLKGRLLETVQLVKDQDVKDKNLLDIGCGYGWFEYNVLKRGVKKVCGIEITNYDLKTIKTYLKNKRAEYKVGSAIDIPYKRNSFDTVVSWEVIEHIPKNTESKMFSEVNRVLKKGGTFYLSTPYDSIPSKFLDPAWWLIGHRHYSENFLIKLGEKHGFSVTDVLIIGRWWRLISSLNMYVSKWIFRRKPVFQNFFKQQEEMELKKKGFANIFIRYKKDEEIEEIN